MLSTGQFCVTVNRFDQLQQALFQEKILERPEFVTEEHLAYLDELQESGITNMYGSRPYLLEHFPDLTRYEGSEVLQYWMETFSERHSTG